MMALVTAVLALNGCANARGVRSASSPSSVDVARASASAAVTSSETGVTSSPPGPIEATGDGSADICGLWDEADASTGKMVAARFGDQRYCFPVHDGRYWVIITMGVGPHGANSAVGVDTCAVTDARCRDGRTDHAFSDFAWLPVPGGGGNTIEGSTSAPFLIIGEHGVYRFDPTLQPLQLQPGSLHS